jgi:RimJ/RimL family protein N-acetyltransferase
MEQDMAAKDSPSIAVDRESWSLSPVIEAERLRLRMFEDRDLDDYARMCADPLVMRHLGGRPLSREETWRQIAVFLGHWQLRGYGLWAAELKDGGEFVGRFGLWNPEGWPGLEIGWAVDRQYWGRGYATEAGAAVMRAAFESMPIGRLISVIHPDNHASIRVAEKLGETRERHAVVNGFAAWIYGIDRCDFASAGKDPGS